MTARDRVRDTAVLLVTPGRDTVVHALDGAAATVVETDPVLAALLSAELGPAVPVHLAEVTDLPFADGAFDAAVVTTGPCVDASAAPEVTRVLRPRAVLTWRDRPRPGAPGRPGPAGAVGPQRVGTAGHHRSESDTPGRRAR